MEALGVGGGGRSGKTQWSDMKPLASALLQTCVEHSAAVADITGTPDRWIVPVGDAAGSYELPSNSTVAEVMQKQVQPELDPSEIEVWAATWNLVWKRSAKGHIGPSFCYMFGEPVAGNRAYLIGSMFRSLGNLAAVLIKDNLGVQLVRPLEFCNSLQKITEQFRSLPDVPDGVSLLRYELDAPFTPGSALLAHASLIEESRFEVCVLTRRMRKPRKARPGEPAAQADGNLNEPIRFANFEQAPAEASAGHDDSGPQLNPGEDPGASDDDAELDPAAAALRMMMDAAGFDFEEDLARIIEAERSQLSQQSGDSPVLR